MNNDERVVHRRIIFKPNDNTKFIFQKQKFYSLQSWIAALIKQQIIIVPQKSATYDVLFHSSAASNYIIDDNADYMEED